MTSAAIVGKSSFYMQTAAASGAFSQVALVDLGDQKHWQPAAVSNWFWDEDSALTVDKRLVAVLETAQGSHKDLKFVAKAYATVPTVTYTDPGAQGDLAVSVVGNDITVTLECDEFDEEVSTASEIMAAINVHPAASALLKAYLKTGSDGSGIVGAMVQTSLSGAANWAEIVAGITVEYLPAIVTLAAALNEYDEVRATGKKFTVTEAGASYDFDTSLDVDMVEATNRDSENAKEYVPGNMGGTVSVGEFFVSPGRSDDLVDGSKLIVVAFVDVDSTPYDLIVGWGYLKGYNPSSSVGAAVDSKLTWTYTGEVGIYHCDYSA